MLYVHHNGFDFKKMENGTVSSSLESYLVSAFQGDFYDNNGKLEKLEANQGETLSFLGRTIELLHSKGLITGEEIKELIHPYKYNNGGIVAIDTEPTYDSASTESES